MVFNYRDGLLTDMQGEGGFVHEKDQERVVISLKAMCRSIYMPFKDIVDERVFFIIMIYIFNLFLFYIYSLEIYIANYVQVKVNKECQRGFKGHIRSIKRGGIVCIVRTIIPFILQLCIANIITMIFVLYVSKMGIKRYTI